MSKQQKYTKDKELSDEVAKTKVAHGKIETAIRVRNAKTKKELDLELRRLSILRQIDVSTARSMMRIPKEIRNHQQLILIVGTLNLKSTTELILACKKLGYHGKITRKAIKSIVVDHYKDLFFYDKEKGWQLTNKGQTEFSRLRQFI